MDTRLPYSMKCVWVVVNPNPKLWNALSKRLGVVSCLRRTPEKATPAPGPGLYDNAISYKLDASALRLEVPIRHCGSLQRP